MDRSTALETIRAARSNRGITYDDLAKKIGTKDATYLAAALHGQHRLNADEAKKLAEILGVRSEEHTSELQSQSNLVCRLLLEKKKKEQVSLCHVSLTASELL